MATTQFDTLTRSLVTTGSRRTLLGTTLGGISIATSWLAAPAASRAKKKHKAPRRDCPLCPPPSPPAGAFCAGKNQCAQIESRHCNENQTCVCVIQADTSGPFCGAVVDEATSCAACPTDTVCVLGGGTCAPAAPHFLCAQPCPNPF